MFTPRRRDEEVPAQAEVSVDAKDLLKVIDAEYIVLSLRRI